MNNIDQMDTLAEIGQYLSEQGKKEFAEFVAMMMLKDESSDEEYVPPVKKGKEKKVFKVEGEKVKFVSSEEEDAYESEDDDDGIEEEFTVKIDDAGFQSIE
tara:strand:+ start:1512 stop:1814 length:303 start_codon:yes stop_codon:yes gene_type:complete